ncbi:MAG TPA: DUF1192 domain-containing protein [Azospirillaceae bacterium]|nr:DUF1192 domain-containing protein [Azospirillaceae bacterium]
MAIEPEDLEPRAKKPQMRDLSMMGVAELEAYIADLETEIARAREVIASKQTHRSAVESLFKR